MNETPYTNATYPRESVRSRRYAIARNIAIVIGVFDAAAGIINDRVIHNQTLGSVATGVVVGALVSMTGAEGLSRRHELPVDHPHVIAHES